MRAARSVPVAACAFACVVSLAGCGGLGVNISNSSNTPNQVAIEATTGVTLNPYPVEIGHTTFLTAHPSAGNVVNYGIAQPVRWDSSSPLAVVLLEGDCRTPYGNEFISTICVRGALAGTANVNATTSNGAVGTLAVKVVI
jgi:hypothetical protein